MAVMEDILEKVLIIPEDLMVYQNKEKNKLIDEYWLKEGTKIIKLDDLIGVLKDEAERGVPTV